MADEGGHPLGAVLSAIASGLSATAGLNAYRAAGGEVRTQTWYRLHGEAMAMSAGELSEANAPLHRIPNADEVSTWTTSSASGFMQHVNVWVRDRESGEVTQKPWSVVGDGVMSRAAAISEALDSYGENAADYDEQILGATYAGTFELVPES